MTGRPGAVTPRHMTPCLASLLLASLLLAGLLMPIASAQPGPAETTQPATTTTLAASDASIDTPTTIPAGSRNGRDIYRRFREGLAETACPADQASARWRKHFAAAPKRLANGDEHVLALFAYVVDAVHAASLPSEYALIPFVESGYNPGARSKSGPAGLWQFIKLTARDHDVEIRGNYDGRLSPVDSTRAAVRYLKTLHGMFAGDWRLAAMAYNAGEYRLLGALRHSDQVARDVDYERLPGLSGITRAYPRKIHAISCLLQQADDRQAWLERLQRPVPILVAIKLTDDTRLKTWATQHGADAAWLRQLNPVYRNGRISADPEQPRPLLAPRLASSKSADSNAPATASTIIRHASARQLVATPPSKDESADSAPAATPTGRTHVVRRGDSLWTIARRYHVRLASLLAHNGLNASSILQPGMVLKIDAN